MSKFIIILGICFVLIHQSNITAAVPIDTTYVYDYDNSGNRTSRVINFLKSAEVNASVSETEEKIIAEKLGEDDILVYPNPTKGDLKIDIPNLNDRKARILLFNSQGKLLIDKTMATNLQEISLHHYSAGFYILKVLIENESIEWKIIKD